MIRCPNCGSTAQAKLLWIDHFSTTHSTEGWECGCGCRIERIMKEQNRIIIYPNGGVQYEENKEGGN